MYNPKHFHLLIASDTNYAEFVSTVCVSLFETNKWFDKANIHLLSNGISDEALKQIKEYIPKDKGELKVYDISNIDKLGLSLYKDKSGFAITSYARLLSTKILPDNISRILYVDCDVIINNNIEDFWNVELGDNYVAGILDANLDTDCKTAIGLSIGDAYVNAGVLLINLDSWRSNNIIDIFESVLVAHDGTVYHQDQGIINEACKNRIKVVHPKYNITSTYFSHPYRIIKDINVFFYSEVEFQEAKNSPCIIHYTEGFLGRPWVKHSNHPYKYAFDKYHSRTIWGNKELREDKRPLVMKYLCFVLRYLPYFVYVWSLSLIDLIKKVNGK